MADNKFKFGKRNLEQLPLPLKGKRKMYLDTIQPGLCIRITGTAVKSFILRRSVDGKPEYLTLGRFPQLSVENARKAAQSVLSEIAKGNSPTQRKRDKRQEYTVKQGFDRYMDDYIRIDRAKRTITEYDRIFDKYIAPRFGSRKLSTLRYQDVDDYHKYIGKMNGKYMANRVIETIKAMYSWLAKKRIYQGENPAWGIEKFKEKSRERFLGSDELPRFFNAVAAEENKDIRDYILLSLLTGARKNNMLAMRWQEINFDNDTWTIPDTKSGEPVTIPLVPAALKILKERAKSNEWVFPTQSKSGHMTDPKRGWKRILDRAQLSDLRLHDLRRSMGSWQAMNQTSLTVIAKSLGHKSLGSTAVYSRLQIDPVRESMEQAARSMLQYDSSSENDNVVRLKAKSK